VAIKMIIEIESGIILLLIKVALWLGTILGMTLMFIIYSFIEHLQQKRILEVLESKKDRDILSAFWLFKRGGK